jgi:hypothetical protein
VAVELSTAALQDAQQQLRASQAASLAQRRRELDLQQTREGAERQAALVQVRQEVLQIQLAARSSKLTTVLEAHLRLKADKSRAQVLSEVAQLDAQGFQARTEAFSANGVAAVRAALVQKLTGISFVIAPPPQNPAPNPAQTSAYSEPIQ